MRGSVRFSGSLGAGGGVAWGAGGRRRQRVKFFDFGFGGERLARGARTRSGAWSRRFYWALGVTSRGERCGPDVLQTSVNALHANTMYVGRSLGIFYSAIVLGQVKARSLRERP